MFGWLVLGELIWMKMDPGVRSDFFSRRRMVRLDGVLVGRYRIFAGKQTVMRAEAVQSQRMVCTNVVTRWR